MIQRIRSNEYMKRVGAMTEVEKLALAKRVGEWLHDAPRLLMQKANEPLAHMQSVIQVGAEWNDAEQSAFNEGVRLLTPFVGIADTWLPDMIYSKAARRCIRRMIDILTAQGAGLAKKPAPKPATMPERKQEQATTPTPTEQTPPKRKRGRPRKVITSLQTDVANTVIPRPKHIDQYAHLLPEETQQRAAQYGPLMRDLDAARQNMRLLMDDKHSTAAEREKWAKVAVRIDERVASIRKELDKEWKKVVETGRVVIDALGIAHITDPVTGAIADPAPKVNFKPDDTTAKPKPKKPKAKPMTEEEKLKRMDYLRKWLRDPRPPVTDERRKLYEQYAKELIRLGGHLTGAAIKNGERYGAKIPKRKNERMKN